MAFQNGHEKFGGRKKGIPNKESRKLEETLAFLGLDPLEQLIKILPTLPNEKQASALLHLLQFLYPKRKAIDFFPAENTLSDPKDVQHLAEKLLQAARNPTCTDEDLIKVHIP